MSSTVLKPAATDKGIPRVLLMATSLVLFSVAQTPAASLVHQFNLDNSLTDALGTGVTLGVHPNTATSGIDANGWTWTATTTPGGGLLLTTSSITNPLDYSLGFRVQFSQVAAGGGGGGSPYRKLVSFRGTTDDNGLYFYEANLTFFPFGQNTAITYSADTFYDFVFSRSASDNVIRVYVVEGDGTLTKVYEETDAGEFAVPIDIGGGHYQFILFMDDTVTSSEWTGGGVCKSIRVWNGPLSQEEAADAMEQTADIPEEEPDVAPQAETTTATNVSDTSATLNGTVNANAVETIVTFEYGTTTAYGSTVTAPESPVSAPTAVAVSAPITGLAAGTLYHFRVVALSAGGTSYGNDQTFETAPAPVEDQYYVIVQGSAPLCGALGISPLLLFPSFWAMKRRGSAHTRKRQ